jgi:short-subunit dehydrogenase
MTNWNGKVVVVTGGSSGLGRQIAAEFLRCGCHVVCLARDAVKLNAAAEELKEVQSLNSLSGANPQNGPSDKATGSVSCVAADVTDDASVAAAVAEIKQSHGQIDVWINNVGRSLRISLADATVSDYRELMEINFISAIRCTAAVLPLLDRTSGHLVNIGSLASKTGWPWVAPYTTSKHALAAYHHQLRLEGPRSVHYLFVCPGPIARSDAGARYSAQASSLPDHVSRPGAGVKMKGISPEYIAKKIRLGCERRKADIVLPWKARIAFALAQLSPRIGDRLLKSSSSGKN